jgi:hypothetical protein
MRLSRASLGPIVVGLALVASSTRLSGQPLDRSGAGSLTGAFVSGDAVSVVIRTDEGTFVAFVVGDQTSVPDGLVPGTRVTVRYDVGADGRYRVVRVSAASFPPEPGSTTSLPPPPAAAPTPGPPSASPPSPTAATASPVVERAPTEHRPAVRTAAARSEERPPNARPAVEEPSREPTAPVPQDAAATEASREPARGGDPWKLAALLLTAAGLAALAYAFARRHA